MAINKKALIYSLLLFFFCWSLSLTPVPEPPQTVWCWSAGQISGCGEPLFLFSFKETTSGARPLLKDMRIGKVKRMVIH